MGLPDSSSGAPVEGLSAKIALLEELRCPDSVSSRDLAGTIGRRVLDNLMPDRRLRLSPRAVKRPLSRYAYKSLKIDRRSYKATLSIDILTPPISP